MSLSSAPPPWTLAVPAGGALGTADRFRDSINARGLYRLTGTSPAWSVEPGHDPPQCLRQLDWRHTARGFLGRDGALRDHLATWPDPALDPATARAALAELAGRSKPETPLDLADACRVAGIAIGMAQGTILPEIAAGVARKLLGWYPQGQMIAWGRSYEHVMAGRPPSRTTARAWPSMPSAWASARTALTNACP